MADLGPLHAILSQPEVMRFLPEDVMSLEEVREVLEWNIDCYSKNTPDRIHKFTVAIAARDSQEILGWCGLGPLEVDESQVEIYFGLARAHWGKGYASQASAALMEYGFETIGLSRIVAVVDPENLASIRVLEKLGMTFVRRIEGLAIRHAAYEGHLYYTHGPEPDG
jgi:ribosomal-protein-alanine N-acetyltransferase